MKKYVFLLIVFSSFTLLGCPHPSSTAKTTSSSSSSQNSGNGDATTVTAKDLIDKLPATIEAFERSFDGSTARDMGGLTSNCMDPRYDYKYYQDIRAARTNSEVPIDVIFAFFKNKIGKISSLSLDTDYDLTALNIEMPADAMHMPADSTGDVRISHKDGVAKLFWNIDTVTPQGGSAKYIIALFGTYNNGKYQNLTLSCTQAMGSQKATSIIQYYKKGDYFYEVQALTGSPEITPSSVIKRKGNTFVSYSFMPEETAKQESKASFCDIFYWNEEGAGYYTGWYNKNIPGIKLQSYYAFDNYGALLMEETNSKNSTSNNASDKFFQAVPLCFMEWTAPIYLFKDEGLNEPASIGEVYNDDVKFYDSSNQEITCIKHVGFDVTAGTSSWETYPCYVQNDISDPTDIDIKDEHFSYKEDMKEKISGVLQTIEQIKAKKAEYEAEVPSASTMSAFETEVLSWADSL